jgi:hypothetical protein
MPHLRAQGGTSSPLGLVATEPAGGKHCLAYPSQNHLNEPKGVTVINGKGFFPKRCVLAALAAIAAVGISATFAEASQAAYGNVYVSFPTWLGNCPGGGSVTGIYATNGNVWSTSGYGDWGDDLIYPRVVMNVGAPYNQINAQLVCSGSYGGRYYGPAVSAAIYPTRGGQTFWIGPAGQRHN